MSEPNKKNGDEQSSVAEAVEEETGSQVAEATGAAETVAKEEKIPETTPTAPAPETEREAGEEEEVEVVEEKVYTIPISKLGYATDRGHRTPKAVRDVRNYVSRHMRADEVSISNEINEAIWERSINKPPRKIVVRAVKDKEGKVVVYPAKT